VFFLKKKNKKLQNLDTIIGPETVVHGNINIKTSLRVDGKVFGEVICDGDVTIGETGYIESSIIARNITIAGSVSGKVQATEKLHILSTGSFNGSTVLNAIVIEEGGVFQGDSTMQQKRNDKDFEDLTDVELTEENVENIAN
jgi:cytoskeletal protein CcmA (bactofilin family)